ncbi:hypothetical protein FACS1894137_01200 [Spirochaetia bacterium]|nr:hypothetical protein FACS1894137_01200 [Spirochaetia bacterium]
MKKILFIVSHLGYGGIEQATINEANLLSEYFNVSIVSTYKLMDNPAFNLNDTVNVQYLLRDKPNIQELLDNLKDFNIFNFLAECTKSIRILYNKKYSIIKFLKKNSYNIIISTRDYFDGIVAKVCKGNALLLAREHRHHNNDFKYIRKLCTAVSNFDYFLPVSKELAQFYSSCLKNKRVAVRYLPNFLENSPDINVTKKEKNIIAVGRFSIEKGFIYMIDIINDLRKTYPDVVLHLIGDGKERGSIESRIRLLNCQDNVFLHGFQNKEYINKWYEKSAIYIMTSLEEALPFVLIEAQSYSLPCVVYDSAQGAKEIIDDNETGYLIAKRDKSEFIEKIVLLFSNEALYKRMSKNAFNHSKKYSKENIEKTWLSILGIS